MSMTTEAVDRSEIEELRRQVRELSEKVKEFDAKFKRLEMNEAMRRSFGRR